MTQNLSARSSVNPKARTRKKKHHVPELVPVAWGTVAEAPEVAPEGTPAPLVAAIPSWARGTPLLTVDVVTQLLEDGVIYAAAGVVVSPTV